MGRPFGPLISKHFGRVNLRFAGQIMSEQKPAEKIKGGWEDWATRTTAILAVIAALSSGRWGASNLQAILKQGQVNDAWAYYQAKSMKEHEAQQSRDLVDAMAKGETPERAASFAALSAKLSDLAQRETVDKQKQFDTAIAYQNTRDKLVESSFWFEISFSALQLGVILCTIAAGAKHKAPWLVGIICGLLGLVILANGFFHVYPAPKAWYQGTSQQMANDG